MNTTTKEKRRESLLNLLKDHAVRFGNFTLASGTKSSYYIDAKLATLMPEGFKLIGEAFADVLEDIELDAVGGHETGAIPIACSVGSVKSSTIFFVRRNERKHGTQKWIEGPLQKNDRVVIVEDVVTTGTSVIKAIKKVQEFGANIVKVIVLVDRLQQAKENIIKECGSDYHFESIFTIKDLGIKD
jgi:orotate phosphoribosyltransferase